MRTARLPILLAGLISCALLLAAALFALMWQADTAKQWVVHTAQAQFLTEQLLGTLRDAETGQRGFLLTNDHSYLGPYDKARAEGPDRLLHLRKLTADNTDQQARLNRIETLMGQKFTELGETIAYNTAGNHARALALVRSDKGKELMETIRAEASSMLDAEGALLVERQRSANRLMVWALAACIAISGVVAALALSIFRHFASQVDRLESVVADRTRHLNIITVELAHRSKNQLALVQSIANQTARYSPTMSDFLEKFGARLQALGRSISELTRQDWRSASLHDLIAAELSWLPPTITRDRISISGPEVQLSPTASHYIGLALHELLTNAVKHGALLNASGHVSITWSVEGPGPQTSFCLTWAEKGGPALTGQPARKGFGTVILGQLTAAALKGGSVIKYAPCGFQWTLTALLPDIAYVSEPPHSGGSSPVGFEADQTAMHVA